METNADYIRSLSNKELLNLFHCPQEIDINYECEDINCKKCRELWLSKECKMENK